MAKGPERLSEMFQFDRRLYIVGPELKEGIIPLLDCVGNSVSEREMLNVVYNDLGVLKGCFIDIDNKNPCIVIKEGNDKRREG